MSYFKKKIKQGEVDAILLSLKEIKSIKENKDEFKN